jgi:NADH-quinone oxidoreductase subunit H
MGEFGFWISFITIAAVLAVILTTCAYLIYVERKICAFMQDRVGPNRVGPMGLLQPLADGLKFLFKEDIIPDRVDKLLYLLAPAISFAMALLAFAVVPFGPTDSSGSPGRAFQFIIAPNIDVGIVLVFAITSMTVYGIVLGGWASNSKYSLLGALRSSAQIISYEIPMGMSILGVVLFTGSLNLEKIIGRQVHEGFLGWNVWYQPLGFLLFLVSVFAECNRLPFDLPEAEQELIGGYHTEYGALKLVLFFVGEYTHVITTSFLLVILFFGGWHMPGIAEPGGGLGADIIKGIVFAIKMTCFILFYMLVRWTIPRFRFDQLMGIAWKGLIPLALANLVCVMIVEEYRLPRWVLLPASLALFVGGAALAEVWPRTLGRRIVVMRGHERQETFAR